MVLWLLKNGGVTLELQKNAFFTNRIDYSSHNIRCGQLAVTSHTADAIGKLETPTKVTEI